MKDPRDTRTKPAPGPRMLRGCVADCLKCTLQKIGLTERYVCAEGRTFDKRFPFNSIPSQCIDRGAFRRRREADR